MAGEVWFETVDLPGSLVFLAVTVEQDVVVGVDPSNYLTLLLRDGLDMVVEAVNRLVEQARTFPGKPVRRGLRAVS